MQLTLLRRIYRETACTRDSSVILWQIMNMRKQKPPPRAHIKQGLALLSLLALGGMAIAGPYGLLAWSENLQLLEQRTTRIAALKADKARLENLNLLLHPDHADPDLVGELLRSNLNVVHPNEVVLTLDESEG